MPHGGRHMFWVDLPQSTQIATGAKSEVDLLVGLTANESRSGITVMRIILMWALAALVHDSGEGSQIVTMGIGIASQEAFAAGALADPETTDDFPTGGWLFRGRARTIAFAADQPAFYERVVERDLRAKRRLNNGVLYQSITNTADQGSTHVVQVAGMTRVLLLST